MTLDEGGPQRLMSIPTIVDQPCMRRKMQDWAGGQQEAVLAPVSGQS